MKSLSAAPMTRNDFKSMSTDELWALREKMAAALTAKLIAETRTLEERLRELKRGTEVRRDQPSTGRRRPYRVSSARG
jgi:DNA-binding protein H-NS